MRILHFLAASPHPKVAEPLMEAARKALWPFDQYLNRAIRTAKDRQVRYKLRWERVRNQRTLGLNPLDTQLLIPKPETAWLVDNWPPGKTPDYTQPLMIVNRSMSIRAEAAAGTNGKLHVYLPSPVYPEDQVFWCGQPCRLTREAQAAPPRQIGDAAGKPLVMRCPAIDANEGRDWRVVVEGPVAKGALWIDGAQGSDDTVQRLPPFSGLHWLFNERKEQLDVTDGKLKVEDLPESRELTGDNGARYRWYEQSRNGRAGLWIQLMPPDEPTADEDFIDPRAAFCEGEVKEIWTQPRHNADAVIKVMKVDADNYQLLVDKLPPQGSLVYLPLDLRGLELQRRALRQLRDAPLPHHQGLLRLCENPAKVRWPSVYTEEPSQWYWLKNPERNGTDQQRDFVVKALATTDFAFLEGPPGSGKTTAICELIAQLIRCNQRVLLCASTNIAIDNVLERMLDAEVPIDAVRIGNPDRVDERVAACRIDDRVNALVDQWRQAPNLRQFNGDELRQMAERTVVASANLTCGTTMGIIGHPLFRDRANGAKPWEQPITKLPHWDVLIVDEASKTTVQEFMVPALMARRWIVVGDVRQLPPFVDRSEIVANLRSLTEQTQDHNVRDLLPDYYQRALVLLFRLYRSDLEQQDARFLIIEPPAVLDALEKELAVPNGPVETVRIVAQRGGVSSLLPSVTVPDLQNGAPASLLLCAARWLLLPDDLFGAVADFLPSSLITLCDCVNKKGANESSRFLFRQQAWLAKRGKLPRPLSERRSTPVETFSQLGQRETEWLERHDWAGEVAWRLIRVHELRRNEDQRQREGLRQAVDQLLPATGDTKPKVKEAIAEVEDIGLPSVLEVIQEGIGEERSGRLSTLTAGFMAEKMQSKLDVTQIARLKSAFASRFAELTFQHRMHKDIADFPRRVIYRGAALETANTIGIRDVEIKWDFRPDLRGRRVWWHVDGREQRGINEAEVRLMRQLLEEFIAWARRKGKPNRALPPFWEVACLCFYLKQEHAISEMLQDLTGLKRKTRFPIPDQQNPLVEIVCGAVDRFQGREADMVLLSMRNSNRVGFLDSINRLNVALTRARQQLIVLGNADWFSDCKVPELEGLVTDSPHEGERVRRRARR